MSKVAAAVLLESLLLLTAIVEGQQTDSSYCKKIILDGRAGADPNVTRISFSGDCKDGLITWSPLSVDSTQIVQFTKNHDPFTICLRHHQSPPGTLSITQLKGVSKREITVTGGIVKCIRSHCNHLSLLLTSNHVPLRSKPHQISYSLRTDSSCSRCSDSCMTKLLCNSDYIFIGSVKKIQQDGRDKYRSQLYIEKYIRYNNSYTSLPSTRGAATQCNKPPTQYALDSDHTVPSSGLVTVVSNRCKLTENKRYFIGTNLKLGYMGKPKLVLSCAQEDIEYMMYELDKLLLRDDGSCC